MSSPAQIAANIANAQHSTGPTTAAGKATASRNAARHGLCATTAVMSDEDQAEFNTLHADLLAEHQPATPTEEILVYKMAANFFAYCRAETLLAERLDFNDQEDQSKQVSLMLRYQTTADRHFNRNLHDLRKLQKERRAAEAAAQATASSPIGSVPQNTEPDPHRPESRTTHPAPFAPNLAPDTPEPAPGRLKKAA